MAKIIDYPRASLANAMQLADAVDSLGGSAKIAMTAEKMGRKVSGAFSAVISAATKYGLVSSKDGRISASALYRNIKLAYTDEERRKHIATALLAPPIFTSIAERFDGKQLPIQHFDRLLIREFGVSDEIAPRVASYFVEGARQSGILTAGDVIDLSGESRNRGHDEESRELDAAVGKENQLEVAFQERSPGTNKQDIEFSVVFRGPGLNSTVVINDEDDMAIVEATLRKISKALKARKLE